MNKYLDVSIILPTRNSATTILFALESINKQDYPIKEILIIDNKSTDESLGIIERYVKKSRYPIIIIRNPSNKGVGASYNIGVAKASAPYIIFMHSDSTLPTKNEITELTKPFEENNNIVATYSKVLMPKRYWEKYTFWMKYLFARAVDKESPGLNGKFDCLEKKSFLKINGFDTENFAGDKGIGGEDADLHERLKKIGSVVPSQARVIHLHYLGSSYSLRDLMRNRKLLARSYGKYLRIHGIAKIKNTLFLVKPGLAILPVLPDLFLPTSVLLLVYSGINSRKMYSTKSTIMNPNILLLPLVDIFLLYYESFWMMESLIKK